MAFVDSSRRTFKAGSDLSNFQYMIGKLDSSGNVIPSTAATDKHVCVIEQNVPSGDIGAMRLLNGGPGTYHVIAGGTIAIGDFLTSNASSLAVATTTSGDQVIGQAIKSAVSGDLVEFLPLRIKYA